MLIFLRDVAAVVLYTAQFFFSGGGFGSPDGGGVSCLPRDGGEGGGCGGGWCLTLVGVRGAVKRNTLYLQTLSK